MARRMRVAKDRKGWPKRVPNRLFLRRPLKAKCGSKCFVGKGTSFPVCQKLTYSKGKCVLDCEGLRAAFARARQTGRKAVARRAVRKACRASCTWTHRANRCVV